MKFNWVPANLWSNVAIKDGIKLRAFLRKHDADAYQWSVRLVNGSRCISLSGKSFSLKQAKAEAEQAFPEILRIKNLLDECKTFLRVLNSRSRSELNADGRELAEKLGDLLYREIQRSDS